MVKLLHTGNSCVNVFLYSVFNPYFRKDVRDLYLRIFRKDRFKSIMKSKDSTQYELSFISNPL